MLPVARRWGYRTLLAMELAVIALLVAGGCYSRQNYHVLSPASGDELLNKCNVVVEGRITSVEKRDKRSWGQVIFFCFSFDEEPQGPTRYNVDLSVERVLKGDPNMPRRIQINNCRPLTPQESEVFSETFFPNNSRVRVGYNHKFGSTFRNLTVVPLAEASEKTPQ